MKRSLLFLLSLFAVSVSISNAQYSDSTEFRQTRIGLGADDFAGITFGPHVMIYANGWLAGITYGLDQNAKETTSLPHPIIARAAYAFDWWGAPRSYWPLYLGMAYTTGKERDIVKGYSGKGTISGLTFMAGTELLRHDMGFLSNIGGHFELGYSTWNYKHSVLAQYDRSSEYKYSNFFLSFSVVYFIQ